MHICHIEDMEAEKSKLLLKDLLNKSTIEKNIYRHSWRTGDLVIWDNRCLLHKADRNYDMTAHPRVLHRTVVRGAIPF